MNRNLLRTTFTAIALLLLASTTLRAQEEPGNVPETKAPAPTKVAPAPAPAPAIDWKAKYEQQLKEDWPWLGKFREADASLPPPAPNENRVVFMGDSITEGWHLDVSFPGKPYINRGISGQTTPQMLVRFRQDVIALQPKVVIILAGTNDIAGNTGPETLEQIEDNLASMADLATANHIRVVLCSITPAFDYPVEARPDPCAKNRQSQRVAQGLCPGQGLCLRRLPFGDEGQRGRPAAFPEPGRRPSYPGRLRHHGASRRSRNREGAGAITASIA